MSTLSRFHGGIHPPEFKTLSNGTPIATPPLPAQLVVPLSQHLGNPAKACVSIGERVLAGQRIGEADGRISAAVHAPTSGLIRAIGPHAVAHPSGLLQDCIVIDSDGLDHWSAPSPLPNWQEAGNDEIRTFLRDMGVVGQGGAVFPTSLKLGVTTLEQLIVNGAECEPFISCDDRLMRERAAEIVDGIRIAAHLMRPRAVLIGIEDNKPEAIAAMRAACAGSGFEVLAIPTLYPSGGAKQLIRLLTGKKVPHGVRATDMGVQCFNVGTLYSLKRAIVDGEPVVSRILTLTGNLARPGNIEARIGTPFAHLLNWAGMQADNEGVIMGGPMMGFDLPGLNAGVSKASNCLIAKSRALFPPRPQAMPCIRCGECAKVCPAELQPMDLYWFAKAKDMGRAQEADLFDCIECGACSYVCPSQLPLVDFYKFAKDEIWAAEREKKAADRARMRHDFRQLRLERDKAEKAQRLAARATPAPERSAAPDPDKAAAIRAAMARAAEKKAEGGSTPAKTPLSDDAKRAAIEAAMARAAANKAARESAVSHAAAPGDEAKRAAIEAAMARAAARKAAQSAEADAKGSSDSAAGVSPAPAPKPVMDADKRAAIEAAMARAAAKKAAQSAAADAKGSSDSAAGASSAPAPKPVMDAEKRAAIEAAMARAAAKKAERDAAQKGDH
ncbi:electron transport complex subunit RsxC [Craterilacuibacter sp. RT1T]|uniref:electron transport complex subunit RsxC n=1 Tax=Craterilacuibacter sp. RT1T TaxID=2942211 RepID=UPI0020BE882D|nr:electron transport complex subunit RsxC [Craterilacuibacter sp. RT1T]MCL6264652.1 electron transport complex subunit RsxC [Craterilacuibacter sp. RT1T]